MKKAILLPALALALISSVAFAFATPRALANGTCLTGDGSGTLSWDNTGSCQLLLDGGSAAIKVFDIADNGTGGNACYSVNGQTQFNSRLSSGSQVQSFMTTGSGGCASYTTGKQFAVVAYTGTCTSYTSCVAAAVGSEVYANMTYNGSIFDFHSGGGGGGGSGNCGWGCGGIPTAYTAPFSSSTAQAAAVGAVADLSSFAWGVIKFILAILLSLLALGLGAYYLYQLGRRDGWSEGTNYAAGEIKKRIDPYR